MKHTLRAQEIEISMYAWKVRSIIRVRGAINDAILVAFYIEGYIHDIVARIIHNSIIQYNFFNVVQYSF